jgi:sugar phosphate isomerase/epimerase
VAGGTPGQLISIENLDYPFEILVPIIYKLGLTICLDIGHLMLHGDDIQLFFNTYQAKIAIIHLYSIATNHYHEALDQLPAELFEPVLSILKNFTGIVSLEIFSFEDLRSSLKFLENHWKMNSPLS